MYHSARTKESTKRGARRNDEMGASRRARRIQPTPDGVVELPQEVLEPAAELVAERRAEREQLVERDARPDERGEVAIRIDPTTADVFFIYGEVLDPYDEDPPPPWASCRGRMFFAVDPQERVAVCFYALRAATRDALATKWRQANADGWRRIAKITNQTFEPPQIDPTQPNR